MSKTDKIMFLDDGTYQIKSGKKTTHYNFTKQQIESVFAFLSDETKQAIEAAEKNRNIWHDLPL